MVARVRCDAASAPRLALGARSRLRLLSSSFADEIAPELLRADAPPLLPHRATTLRGRERASPLLTLS